ncbi:formin-like protein 20 [Ipomoea triloba]|uniref:formin-like protein 20 n=1 Tax=Ipomoea triloba TaxID=35885 RepID=UPI00125E1DD8|nr:formin-like protein 20 [Ipomoea triloba]
MADQNEKPPTNQQQQHIDRKRKDVATSSNNNDDNNKATRINPEHEDMLDLSLWSPNHSATPPSSSSSPPDQLPHSITTPSPSQWQLSLSPLSSSPEEPSEPSGAHPPPPPPPPPPSAHPPNPSPSSSPPEGAGERERDGSSEGENDNDNDSDSETIVPPYAWATDRPAIVHTLDHLLSNLQIEKIKGGVKCKRCECEYEMDFDLRDKFSQLEVLIWENKDGMYERAPEVWKTPILPKCRYCHQENSAKPVISRSKKAINWLFLLLGQLLGCCTLDQLKYFCQHTKNHRTGAKDRLLYLVYLTLCKQLRPNDPNFDR